MQRKINLNLFGFEGSLSRVSHRTPEMQKAPHEWLLDENKAFLAAQLQRIKTEQYDQVIVAQASRRQDKSTDHNRISFGMGSCAPVPAILQSWFASQLECEVVLDPFLLADIYGKKKEAGESYKAILKELYDVDSKIESHASAMSDKEKIILVYAHAHRVAELNPDAEIVIDFFEANAEKLDHIYAVMNDHKNLLPANVTLRLHLYNEHNEEVPADDICLSIKGEGKLDTHYEWSLRYLGATTSGKPADIKLAQELRNYHLRNFYFDKPGEGRVLSFPHSKLSPEQFIAFRDGHEMSQLAAEKQLHAANYTTAEALRAEGLIPAAYVVGVKPAPLPMMPEAAPIAVPVVVDAPEVAQAAPANVMPADMPTEEEKQHYEEEKQHYYGLLEQLRLKHEELNGKFVDATMTYDIDPDEATSYFRAVSGMWSLHQHLISTADDFFNGDIDLSTFKRQSQQHIMNERGVLEQHRDCNYILANIGLAIAGLGLGYLIAGFINLARTGKFIFFSKTDSATKVDAVETQLRLITNNGG